MKPTTVTLYHTWQHYKLAIRYTGDYLSAANAGEGDKMARIEVHVLEPEKAALPITDTGYKSHVVPNSDIIERGGAAAYVEAWLNHEAESEYWLKQRQKDKHAGSF